MSGISSWLWGAASAASIGPPLRLRLPSRHGPRGRISAAVAQSSYYRLGRRIRFASRRSRGCRACARRRSKPTSRPSTRTSASSISSGRSRGARVGRRGRRALALSPAPCQQFPDPARASNYSDHYPGLRRLEARYGVDPSVLMAIWGHETSYGTVTGRWICSTRSPGSAITAAPRFLRERVRRRAQADRSRRSALAVEGQLGRRDRLSAVHAVGRASAARGRRRRRLCRHLVQ